MQDILKAEMDEQMQKTWAERALKAVVFALPAITRSVMQPHVEQCVTHVRSYNIHKFEAEQLLHHLVGTNKTRRRLP